MNRNIVSVVLNVYSSTIQIKLFSQMNLFINRNMFNSFIFVDSGTMWFKVGQRGCRVLMVDNFSYNRNRQTDDKTYWICARKVSVHELSLNVY